MRQDAAQKYQSQQAMTASPAKLVAMLYDRIIQALNDAIRAIEEGNIEGRWRANKTAIEIISQLALHLDMERGGDIAANLDRLYRYALRRLPEVDLHNDPKAAREIIGILEPLRQSWHELARRNPPPTGGPAAPADDGPDKASGIAFSA